MSRRRKLILPDIVAAVGLAMAGTPFVTARRIPMDPSRPPFQGACPSNGQSAVGAVHEGVNECQAGNSPPDTGGVAAPSRKRCEATAAAQTGWSGLPKCFGMRSLVRVPFPTAPSAPLKEASRLLLDVASTPPMSGGEWHAQFIHTF